MVKIIPARALHATPIPERFDLPGATAHGGAGPWLDYALSVKRLGGLASAGFDQLKGPTARYSGGFDVALLILLRPLGFIRPQDFAAVARDPYLAAKLGSTRLPDPSTVNRALHRLASEAGRARLRRLHRSLLACALRAGDEPPYVILDGDSTVEVAYGEAMEGAEVGYNPKLRGRRSYRPLLFTDGVRELVLGSWLRPGDAGDKTDLLERYCEMRDQLAEMGRPIRFARFDRGFRGEDLYARLEQDKVDYTVKTQVSAGIRTALGCAGYREISDEGDPEQIQVTDVRVKLEGWSQARRVVVVRTRPRDFIQCSLGDWGWRYEAVVTSLDWSPADVWRFYNRRCQAENLIKELKEGYGIDKLSTGSFGANDADLMLKVIAFNLFRAFQREVMQQEWRPLTVRSLRIRLLGVPGVLVRHARGFRIRLASWYPYIQRFMAIRRRVDALVT